MFVRIHRYIPRGNRVVAEKEDGSTETVDRYVLKSQAREVCQRLNSEMNRIEGKPGAGAYRGPFSTV